MDPGLQLVHHLFFSSIGLVALPDGMSNVDTNLTTLLSIQVTAVIGPLFRNIDAPCSNLLFDFLSYISLGNSFQPDRKVPHGMVLLVKRVCISGKLVKKLSKNTSCHFPYIMEHSFVTMENRRSC